MTKKTKYQENNTGKWKDESKGIITSNGEIEREHRYYFINCDLNITSGDSMTADQLRRIAYYCECIAKSYNANKEYLI